MNKEVSRNEPCPCGSGKKFKRCCMQKQTSDPSFSWMDDDGLHFVAPGVPPTPDQIERMTDSISKSNMI
jgi:hypothetical protein